MAIMAKQKQPLSVTHPEIAAEWHPTKNDKTPAEAVAGSAKKYWWKCPEGPDHEWEATVDKRTYQGSGCPFCAGRQVSDTNSLATQYPEIAAQWHSTKNDKTPAEVVAGSNKKYWWICPEGQDHEWEASLSNRTAKKSGCPFCVGQKLSVTNSLAEKHPDIAAEWHPTKNDKTPAEVVAGSNKKYWWKCPEGPDHEWEATVVSRTNQGSGCPFCAGKQVSDTNSLATQYPEIAAEWHPTRNGDLTPADVVAGSDKKVWWKCPNGPDHEWQVSVDNRSRGKGCPFCAGLKVSVTNSLAAQNPDIAKQWHPTKNDKTPAEVVAGSAKKYWWKCPEGPDHEWEATVDKRTYQGSGCPFCAGRQVSDTNSLATQYPEIAAQWHPTKNDKTPAEVVAGSSVRYWWICPEGQDHEWEASLSSRTSLGSGCPFCVGQKVSVTNSLATQYPEIAAQWHPTKNDKTPAEVVAGSGKKYWWKCPEGPDHEWEATVDNRTANDTGCPFCNMGWTVGAIRNYVRSLRDHLENFTAAELYVIFQQSGILAGRGKGRGFVKALATGRFPPDELEKFIEGEPSLVDQFVDDVDLTLEEIKNEQPTDSELDDLKTILDEDVEKEPELPVVETKDVLAALDSQVVTSADAEAVDFLTASATAKIWRDVFHDEEHALTQAKSFDGGEYAMQVRNDFLDEYHSAKGLEIPLGYAFTIEGNPVPPNLMQRLAAVRVRDNKRVGNWSGTGAGKTLSAVLASRVIGAQVTIICCPNSVVDGWRDAIIDIYLHSHVATKDFKPEFDDASDWPKFLVFNYEAFQQPDSHVKVRELVERYSIDFVVVDEIHYSKQREADDMSRRRQMVTAMIQLAGEQNPDFAVLGMSATPVINNLQEGRSLIELITGVEHADLSTKLTVSNCMRMHQQLVRLGIRWMPEYDIVDEEVIVEIDCFDILDEVRQLQKVKGTPLALEQILTRKRLPAILDHVQPKTLIYTHYVQGIDRVLREALEEAGWKTGFYTGDDKSGLERFLHGDLDVLIGSSAIGTGVDGLQHVCSRLIINVLPWTAAAYEQLKGRIYRQGQKSDRVQIIVPVTYADVDGERWSWCDSKLNRIKFKKSVADAAVDGVVPEGHLRTPGQAYQDIMQWLERLDSGEVEAITRRTITVPLPTDDLAEVKKRQSRYGDFSRLNNTWNRRNSGKTHEALQRNPEEWEHYHTLYRESRATWATVPYEELIRWLREREGLVVGDFGCGEAKIDEAVSDRHFVHSFDHVAINDDDVVACDMANVPLDDDTLDVAVFSLSLMGSNFADYLREGHRTLKLDGQLHIFESTSRFSNRDSFVESLKQMGFDQFAVEDRWKFTYIRALKTNRVPNKTIEMCF